MNAPVSAPGQKWWGWGSPSRRVELPPGALEVLRRHAGEAEPAAPVAVDQVAMPEPRSLPRAVGEAVGETGVLTGREHRLRRAAGRGYPDLIRLRSGRLPDAPDAVVVPASEAEVARLLAACAAEGIAVVPFGGGTSVVGGVEVVRDGFEAAISLDLHRLRAVDVDPTALTARLGPGLRGPEAEAELGAHGVTLAHFPQSFEYATIGGFAATRSAGQASSGVGRFDELVTSVRMQAPAGELRTLATPHTAAGPALRELVLGSEGTLGVITEVGARVRPLPQKARYEGWIVRDFAAGRELLRELAQEGSAPDVIRLSDESETELQMGMAQANGKRRRVVGVYLGLRRRRGGCLVICGWEGTERGVDLRRGLARSALRAGGAVSLGPAPGRAWHEGRYEGPYLRDALLDAGYLVETLETAHTWSRLGELYEGVRAAIASALAAQGAPGIVMCHISHVYGDGASLYFTFIAPRRPREEIEQWRATKTAACEAIVAAAGTITHHHAVGRDHAPYMRAEVGELGVEALRALKARFDPAGVMNPGKLLPG